MADKWREVRKGFEKWMRLACYCMVGIIFLNVLPHLPDEIAVRIIDALLEKVGIERRTP